jgi:spore coat protein U-like protein
MSSTGSQNVKSPRRRAIDRALARAIGCVAIVCLAGVLFGGQRAEAATRSIPLAIGASISIRCTIITVPLSFGNYTVTNPTHLDAEGAISLNCTPSNFMIRIRLDQGLQPAPGSNSPNPLRQMSDGVGHVLRYNIYRNAARSLIWGGNSPNDMNPSNGPWPMLLPVYGRITALQSVQPGSYADTVQASVLF